jgi:hypothetical protein
MATEFKLTKEVTNKVLMSLVKSRELSAPEVIAVMRILTTNDVDILDFLINELRNWIDSV